MKDSFFFFEGRGVVSIENQLLKKGMRILEAREWKTKLDCTGCTSALEVGFDDLYLDPKVDLDEVGFVRFACPVCFRPDIIRPDPGIVYRLRAELVGFNIDEDSDEEVE